MMVRVPRRLPMAWASCQGMPMSQAIGRSDDAEDGVEGVRERDVAVGPGEVVRCRA